MGSLDGSSITEEDSSSEEAAALAPLQQQEAGDDELGEFLLEAFEDFEHKLDAVQSSEMFSV